MNDGSRSIPVFERAVIAVTFSPRLIAVLNTARFLLKKINTNSIIVHAGEESPAIRVRLKDAIDQSDFKTHTPEFVFESGHVSDAIIRTAEKYGADLIVAGANAKENLLRYYLGSIARRLIRYVPCSLLLLTHPRRHPVALKRIHCTVDFHKADDKAVEAACYFADSFNAELYFTHSFILPDWDETINDTKVQFYQKVYRSKEKQLDSYLKEKGVRRSYSARCVAQNWSGTVLKYSQEIGANLIVMSDVNISKGLLGHIMPKSSDVPLTDLPCSLLLIRDADYFRNDLTDK